MVTITIERDDDGKVTTSVVKNGELRYIDQIETEYSRNFLWSVLAISKMFSPPDTDDNQN